MKIIQYLFFFTLLVNARVPDLKIPDDKVRQVKQAQLWRDNLNASRQLINKEKYELLKLGLRNMGYQRQFEGNGIWLDEIFFDLQKEFLQDPNYINYFTEKIETERAKVAADSYYTGERNAYNSLRFYIIEETLCYLPRPPTIAALGKYLYDERDTPPPMKPGQDWIDTKSNAYLACTALAKIGLRNAPVPPRVAPDESHLATWRLWWEQVQAGTRSFSFEGEAVEYRFRKDGTWETSTWKNESLHVSDNSTTHRVAEVFASSHNRWLMVLTGILLGMAWLRWKKHRRIIK